MERLTVIRWGLAALGLLALVACGPGAAPDGGVGEATVSTATSSPAASGSGPVTAGNRVVSTTTALPAPGVEVGQPDEEAVEAGSASAPESPTDDGLEALMAELDAIEELLADTERLLYEPPPEP